MDVAYEDEDLHLWIKNEWQRNASEGSWCVRLRSVVLKSPQIKGKPETQEF